jgi:hypothetical protein
MSATLPPLSFLRRKDMDLFMINKKYRKNAETYRFVRLG